LPDQSQNRKEVKSMSDDFFDIGWEEMALAGSLAEEMAEETKERLRLDQEMEVQESDCCCEECEPNDPPDEPLDPPDNQSDDDPYP
jgi:hypothetical protein